MSAYLIERVAREDAAARKPLPHGVALILTVIAVDLVLLALALTLAPTFCAGLSR